MVRLPLVLLYGNLIWGTVNNYATAPLGNNTTLTNIEFVLNTSGDLTSPSNSLKTQLVSIYNLFANYSGSVPANLVAWAPGSSGGSAAGSVIGTDLGSSTLNN